MSEWKSTTMQELIKLVKTMRKAQRVERAGRSTYSTREHNAVRKAEKAVDLWITKYEWVGTGRLKNVAENA